MSSFESRANTGSGKTTFVIITGCAGSGKTTLGKRLSSEMGWTYIDKDTLTRDFTDFILMEKGKSKSDRESDTYSNSIRPIEYKITFSTCKENLRLGNSVILTIPFIAQIKDYNKWLEMLSNYSMDLSGVTVKFIWINHDEESEFNRITRRGAERDGYKLCHWKEYAQSVANIEPDPRYGAYRYDNTSIDENSIKDIITWIEKRDKSFGI